MSRVQESPPPTPLPLFFATGIGWLWRECLFPAAPEPAADGGREALNPAGQRQSAMETALAAALAGGWTFLAVGALLLGQGGLSTGALLLRLALWPLAWVALLHALVLLPPLLLLPWSRPGGMRQDCARGWHEALAHAMLLALAWRLAQMPGWPGRALGWSWMLLILVEMILRLLRAGLRLARRRD